ncbi:(deoxy)nucleoside triphosphate pyrophosphohydrolase [Streptomyces sp. SID3343]|uniref:(deoxy)nucleoside triphosphate pyrophosphohydrolase n=1 Tax=Streptomyces sp. SID3343 TaxID=2690260 RepID=UPI00136E6F78|nr:(deoxy)nucleoside triphosphate pyrophosphohydrolase [Streptomyces sp. SID3343]MYW03117.1 NUDIX domain-containing protein [Streptomyces sp. SID3343]
MTGTRIVVGAAIVDRGRVLAACRSAPPELVGGWEFPGGKVEPGESEEAALVRECHEELGVRIRPVRRLPGEWPLGRGYVLRVWTADLVDGDPRPLQDHSALRWLGPDSLDDVAWLPQDRPAVDLIAAELRIGPYPTSHDAPHGKLYRGERSR